MNAQTYTIRDVRAYSQYPYFAGSLQVQSQIVPVCFVFDNSGVFVIGIDGIGTCPLQNSPPSCSQSGSSVIQVWTGQFFCKFILNSLNCNFPPVAIHSMMLTFPALPVGTWKGTISILPYTTTPSGYQCLTQCTPIISSSTLTWSYNTLYIDIAGGISPQGCTLSSQRYAISEVAYHTTYYYGGYLSVAGQAIPVCFYFPSSGGFVLLVDGRGSCPQSSAAASCVAGSTPGTVVQTWTGFYQRA